MSGRLRLSLGFIPSIAGLLLFLNSLDASGAAPMASWSLYSRASNTSFVTGPLVSLPPATGTGYEIVSFDAVPISTGLATYMYGGADLPPARGGPMAPIVSCDLQITSTTLSLLVDNAYPYAGCVFFLGATNTGDVAVDLGLGPPDPSLIVQCEYPGCEGDMDILAGGPDTATIDALCTKTGAVTHVKELLYELAPGATMACPVFIVFDQTAHQQSTWRITKPPSDEPTPTPERPQTEVPTPTSTPVPTTTPTPPGPTPPAPTATPTPAEVVLPATPPVSGVDVTPVAPSTGSGLSLTARSEKGMQFELVVASFLLVFAGPIGFWLLWTRQANARR